MTTRLIMRTNFRGGDPGFMPDTALEVTQRKQPAADSPQPAAGTTWLSGR
jgi:hypothetical protein